LLILQALFAKLPRSESELAVGESEFHYVSKTFVLVPCDCFCIGDNYAALLSMVDSGGVREENEGTMAHTRCTMSWESMEFATPNSFQATM
jgi:hypothetical protein